MSTGLDRPAIVSLLSVLFGVFAAVVAALYFTGTVEKWENITMVAAMLLALGAVFPGHVIGQFRFLRFRVCIYRYRSWNCCYCSLVSGIVISNCPWIDNGC